MKILNYDQQIGFRLLAIKKSKKFTLLIMSTMIEKPEIELN